MKKVTLNIEGNEIIFRLNHQHLSQNLQIHCKFAQENIDLWATFQITDLQPLYQTLFQKISNLFHYISQNTEEIEVSKQHISININYLNQTRLLLLPLAQMKVFSQYQLEKLQSKINHLQLQNKTLQSQILNKNIHKLTLPCNRNTVKTPWYEFINEFQIRPFQSSKLMGLFYNQHTNHLPTHGIWYFHLFITQLANQKLPYFQNTALTSLKQHAPQLEIGIRSVLNEQQLKASAVFYSNQRFYLSNTTPNTDDASISQDSIDQHDIFKVIINIDSRQIAIQKNFQHTKTFSWQHLKGDKLLLYLNFYRLQVRTDLFIKPAQIIWSTHE